MAQHYPVALPAWWRLLETVLPQVPPHWLVAAVKPLFEATSVQRYVATEVSLAGCRGSVPPFANSNDWPASRSDENGKVWDMGVASAETDVLAALYLKRLPAALLAHGVAAADSGGVGGVPVLFEIPLRGYAESSLPQARSPTHVLQ
jgi:hypothetical protein